MASESGAPASSAASVVADKYMIGIDRTVSITCTSGGIVWAGGPMTNLVTGQGYNTWSFGTVTPAFWMQFAFSENVTLQKFIWEMGSAGAWGVWTVSVYRNGGWEATSGTHTIGTTKWTEIAIPEAQQDGVSGIRLDGVSGTISNAPWVYNAYPIPLEEP